MRTLSLVFVLLGVVLLASFGCDSGGGDGDGDGDGDADVGNCDPSLECCADSDCSDEIYCNGVERCVDNSCSPGEPIVCDDGIECTVDSCDEAVNVCVFVPDHASCDDLDACDGVERCDPTDADADANGCIDGVAMFCDDGQACTEDFCQDGECQARLVDLDDDGYADSACQICDDVGCERGEDCDDEDGEVNPGATEICDDGKDNNCDRAADYADATCDVPNDSCDEELTLTADTPVRSSTRDTSADIDDGCAPSGDDDVAFQFTLSAASDIEVSVETAHITGMTIALTSDCGDAGSTIACQPLTEDGFVRRGLGPGAYVLVVSANSELDFTIELTVTPETADVGNDTCAAATAIATDGTEVIASTEGAHRDYHFGCAENALVDVAYDLVLSEPQSVDFYALLRSTTGEVAVAVQDTCGFWPSERYCYAGDVSTSGSVWRLPAGTFTLLVGSENESEIEVIITTSEVDSGVYLYEEFNSDPGGWSLQNDWRRDVPGGGGDPDPNAGGCIANAFGENYASSLSFDEDYAQTPAIDLTGATNPVLTFMSWMHTESCCDGGHLEIATSASGPFELLDPTGLSPAYDGTVASESAWKGDNSEWAEYSASLADYVGETVWIRFAMRSDSSFTYAGWYIDTVVVAEQ